MVTNKPVHKLLAEVSAQWDTIRFTRAAGHRIDYSVILHSALGDIHLVLFPELLPNTSAVS
jgi:hypothetical protein